MNEGHKLKIKRGCYKAKLCDTFGLIILKWYKRFFVQMNQLLSNQLFSELFIIDIAIKQLN